MKNYLLEENLLEEQILKNRELEKCYANIVNIIKRISSSLDDPTFKEIIETDHRKYPESTATIFECITPYCAVSLGADGTGYFNLVYSLDYRAIEMIGEFALSNLLRNIYRFTMIGYTSTPIEQRVKTHGVATEIDFERLKAAWKAEDNLAFATFSN